MHTDFKRSFLKVCQCKIFQIFTFWEDWITSHYSLHAMVLQYTPTWLFYNTITREGTEAPTLDKTLQDRHSIHGIYKNMKTTKETNCYPISTCAFSSWIWILDSFLALKHEIITLYLPHQMEHRTGLHWPPYLVPLLSVTQPLLTQNQYGSRLSVEPAYLCLSVLDLKYKTYITSLANEILIEPWTWQFFIAVCKVHI